MSTVPTYSVVITAHNAASTIAPCLQSIAAQAGIGEGALEIVLVDDRSTDKTAETALALKLPNLHLIRVEEPMASGLTTRQDALTLGFRAAKGDVVLVLDADGIAATNWVVRQSAPIVAGNADAVAGPVTFSAKKGMLGRWQTVDVADYLATNKVLVACGAKGGALFGNFAFRRELFEQAGGFSKIGLTLTEDLALALEFQANGARLFYADGPSVGVAACDSWRVLIDRAKRVSAGGLSALSVTIGVRMALLPLLGASALLFGGVFTTFFLMRYVAGVLFVGWSLLRIGKYRLLPLTLLYEPLAIVIGLAVMWRIAQNAEVEWGGKKYAR